MPKTKLPLWLLKKSDQAALLRQTAPAVKLDQLSDRAMQQLIDDMILTMRQANGVGLAAPQVGRSLRIAIIDAHAAEQSEPFVLINPAIYNVSSAQHEIEEGCLSIPKVYGPVPRARRLTLRAFDRTGKAYIRQAEDFFARVIQHELDHLNGRLFIDRASAITSGKVPS